jgi:hypothetical protein
LRAVQAICGLDEAIRSGDSDFAGPNGVDMSFHARLSWPDGRASLLDSCCGAKHIAEHEFLFEHAVVRLRYFLLPMAGPAPLNLVVNGSDSRAVICFEPVAYYDRQHDRIRALLTSKAGHEGDEPAVAERVRLTRWRLCQT